MTDTDPRIPKMTGVESTNIESVGHDGSDLFVRFKSGGLYRYPNVPPEIHGEFLKEGVSPGGHFRAAVAGKFPHTKIQ